MRFTLNGESMERPEPLSLAALLDELDYDRESIAVAVNGAFLPRGAYADTPIREKDDLDVVAPMQGG